MRLNTLMCFAIAGIAFSAWAPVAARADLTGTTVAGQLLFNGNPPNQFDSANGGVPATGYGNSGGNGTVVIGSGPEFGYADGADEDIADFTSSGALTLTDISVGGSYPITYVFTDPAFTSVSLISSSYPAGLTASLSGDVLTILAPELATPGTYSAEFAVGSASVTSTPEPGGLALLGTGILGLGGIVRRRIRV